MSKKKKLIIFGNSIMAQIALHYFKRDSEYVVEAFCVDEKYNTGADFCDLPVVNFETVQTIYPSEDYEMFIAVGPTKMNGLRAAKFYEARAKGYKLASYISPRAICESEVGENSFIGDFAIVHPFVKIGENNFVWEYVLVGNNCKIENHGYFSPKSVISTFSHIKDNVILGTSSIVKTGIVVETGTLVGASCFISVNTERNGVYGEKSSQLYGCISDKIDISKA